MKTKLSVFLFACLAVTGTVRAEFKLASVVTEARNDKKNAPAIVANAALDNPKALLQIVKAAVKALPDEATAILEELLKVAPKRAAEIVKTAILAQPNLARELTSVAMTTLPEQATEILKAAVDAAPDDLKSAVAATTVETHELRDSSVAKVPSFPVQPIRPDLVSPSS